MSSRSATLLGLGLLMLGIAAAAAGLGRAARDTVEPAPVLVAPPVRPLPVANRDAVRQAANLSDVFVSIAEAVTPAVVRITAEQSGGRDAPEWLSRRLQDLFGPPRDSGGPPEPVPPAVSGGTGFLISTDGLVLTNDHVIAGASRITVSLSDKRVFEARVVGRDPTTDVALVRIDARNVPALPLGDSDAARVGEWVIAVGNPGFDEGSTLDFTVTGGIISAKGRPLNLIPNGLALADPAAGAYAIEDFLQTDAVINPGNSGGPLLNLKGEVIGVNTAIASSTGFNQGYAFAIPSNLAARVVRDLIAYGRVRRPLLGVQIADITPEDAEAYGLEQIAGVRVDDFGEDSPARAAGLERHDVIIGLNDAPVERVGQLQRLVALNAPGDTVSVRLVRWGRRLELPVVLGEVPLEQSRDEPPPPRPDAPPGLGFEVAELDAATARELGYDRAGGAVVADVVPFGAADRKGIASGDRLVAVGKTAVRSAREARTLIRSVSRGQVVTLLLQTPEGRTYIANIRVE